MKHSESTTQPKLNDIVRWEDMYDEEVCFGIVVNVSVKNAIGVNWIGPGPRYPHKTCDIFLYKEFGMWEIVGHAEE